MKERSRAGRTELLQTQDFLNFVICSHSIRNKAYYQSQINKLSFDLPFLKIITYIHKYMHKHTHTFKHEATSPKR